MSDSFLYAFSYKRVCLSCLFGGPSLTYRTTKQRYFLTKFGPKPSRKLTPACFKDRWAHNSPECIWRLDTFANIFSVYSNVGNKPFAFCLQLFIAPFVNNFLLIFHVSCWHGNNHFYDMHRCFPSRPHYLSILEIVVTTYEKTFFLQNSLFG